MAENYFINLSSGRRQLRFTELHFFKLDFFLDFCLKFVIMTLIAKISLIAKTSLIAKIYSIK